MNGLGEFCWGFSRRRFLLVGHDFLLGNLGLEMLHPRMLVRGVFLEALEMKKRFEFSFKEKRKAQRLAGSLSESSTDFGVFVCVFMCLCVSVQRLDSLDVRTN